MSLLSCPITLTALFEGLAGVAMASAGALGIAGSRARKGLWLIMPYKMPSRCVLSLLTILTAVDCFAGTISYSVVPILLPSGFTNVVMTGINDSGQVAGAGQNGAQTKAFISTPGGSTVIPLPAGWNQAVPYAINNSGQISGTLRNPGPNPPEQAFIGTDTAGITAIPLGQYDQYSFGFGINDSGQVGGYVPGAAFIGTTSGETIIPYPAGWTEAAGSGINNSGQIAGWGRNSAGLIQAFIGTAEGSTAIPLPDGWDETDTTDLSINDSGQVVGTYNGGEWAFIATVLGMTEIPLPAGATYASTSYTSAINDAGVIVGYSDAGGWMFDTTSSDVPQLLNSMVPTGWDITGAVSINQNGIILAKGKFDHGPSEYVELASTRTPEPACGLLEVAASLLLMFCAPRAALRFR